MVVAASALTRGLRAGPELVPCRCGRTRKRRGHDTAGRRRCARPSPGWYEARLLARSRHGTPPAAAPPLPPVLPDHQSPMPRRSAARSRAVASTATWRRTSRTCCRVGEAPGSPSSGLEYEWELVAAPAPAGSFPPPLLRLFLVPAGTAPAPGPRAGAGTGGHLRLPTTFRRPPKPAATCLKPGGW